MTKRKSIILYTVYALFLTLILIFGSSISALIKENLLSITHNGAIKDVEVQLEDSYVIEEWYQPSYSAIGTYGENPQLVFKAVDKTLIAVEESTGRFRGKRTAEDKTVAEIKITSNFDKTFEKIITVNLEKRYPETFEARYAVQSLGYVTSYVFVGIPVLPYVHPTSDTPYSETDFTAIYDENYFREGEGSELIPIKATASGERTSITLVFPNGQSAQTHEFEIRKQPAPIEEFDEIVLYKMWDKPDDVIGNNYFIQLMKEGKRVYSEYELTIDGKAVALGERYNLIYNKAGTSTVTVTLPSGFSKSAEITVKNILSLPIIENTGENDTLAVTYRNDTAFAYSFDSSSTHKWITLEYDKKVLSASYVGDKLFIRGLKVGDHKLTVVVDDGTQRIEKTFTVTVSKSLNVFQIMLQDPSYFVAKILGHLLGFGLLSVLALNMFRFIGRKRNPLLVLLDYSGCALCIAATTEFIQYFIPDRSGTFDDIVYDMISYYIGTAVTLGVAAIVLFVRHIITSRALKKKS